LVQEDWLKFCSCCLLCHRVLIPTYITFGSLAVFLFVSVALLSIYSLTTLRHMLRPPHQLATPDPRAARQQQQQQQQQGWPGQAPAQAQGRPAGAPPSPQPPNSARGARGARGGVQLARLDAAPPPLDNADQLLAKRAAAAPGGNSLAVPSAWSPTAKESVSSPAAEPVAGAEHAAKPGADVESKQQQQPSGLLALATNSSASDPPAFEGDSPATNGRSLLLEHKLQQPPRSSSPRAHLPPIPLPHPPSFSSALNVSVSTGAGAAGAGVAAGDASGKNSPMPKLTISIDQSTGTPPDTITPVHAHQDAAAARQQGQGKLHLPLLSPPSPGGGGGAGSSSSPQPSPRGGRGGGGGLAPPSPRGWGQAGNNHSGIGSWGQYSPVTELRQNEAQSSASQLVRPFALLHSSLVPLL
jgi:hypothetical protein